MLVSASYISFLSSVLAVLPNILYQSNRCSTHLRSDPYTSCTYTRTPLHSFIFMYHMSLQINMCTNQPHFAQQKINYVFRWRQAASVMGRYARWLNIWCSCYHRLSHWLIDKTQPFFFLALLICIFPQDKDSNAVYSRNHSTTLIYVSHQATNCMHG
jgi:hypothetical protein